MNPNEGVINQESTASQGRGVCFPPPKNLPHTRMSLDVSHCPIHRGTFLRLGGEAAIWSLVAEHLAELRKNMQVPPAARSVPFTASWRRSSVACAVFRACFCLGLKVRCRRWRSGEQRGFAQFLGRWQRVL